MFSKLNQTQERSSIRSSSIPLNLQRQGSRTPINPNNIYHSGSDPRLSSSSSTSTSHQQPIQQPIHQQPVHQPVHQQPVQPAVNYLTLLSQYNQHIQHQQNMEHVCSMLTHRLNEMNAKYAKLENEYHSLQSLMEKDDNQFQERISNLKDERNRYMNERARFNV